MLIGKAGAATTSISTADAASITVRGRDLCGDVMGRLSFTEYFHLLVTGREPSEAQRFFLDLLLVAIAEHGLVPTNQAARMTYAADPGVLQAAVAAGILGCGSVVLGTAEACGRFLADVRGKDLAAHVAAIRAGGGKVPGFGHPLHKPVDPRAERIMALAEARGAAGAHCALARETERVVPEVWGKPLPMNVSMPIAAVLLDLDFPPAILKGIPILARTASLIAHLAEESANPIGFLMASEAEAAIAYVPEAEGVMRDPAAETLPWEAQVAADAAAWREQVGYLLEHSAFYRSKLAAAGFRDAASVGGLEAIAALPFTEKDELRASRTEAHPIGAHVAAPMREVVRIYSTSGTSGTPSYIPLTGSDLADWIEISSRSYAASGIHAGDRIVTTYGAGPFAAGAALDAFAALGLTHIPLGPGHTDRLLAAIDALAPDAIALTPSYALHLAEIAAAREFDLAASSVARLLVAGEPGGAEAEIRARLEQAWGATVTEAMGIGDIAVSLWGECSARNGMHFSGRGFVHVELIDPESGVVLPFADGAEGELVYTHLRHRAAPLLRFRSRDHVRVRAGACACGRTAPRVRCIGRTDDMLILRGVNLFPTAVREVVAEFAPAVSGGIAIRPRRHGVRQAPPLPVVVELAEGHPAEAGLAEAIQTRLRERLVVSAEVELAPWGSLPRSDYKSKLVDWSRAES